VSRGVHGPGKPLIDGSQGSLLDACLLSQPAAQPADPLAQARRSPGLQLPARPGQQSCLATPKLFDESDGLRH